MKSCLQSTKFNIVIKYYFVKIKHIYLITLISKIPFVINVSNVMTKMNHANIRRIWIDNLSLLSCSLSLQNILGQVREVEEAISRGEMMVVV